ncbi:DUF1178 family protein [Sphingopyxis sp. MWB1]|uniref:DUF1178 family protein n=1 Tax=Sphingopyxis sp. MWB1 TaxID=1537715 RepID=UPI00051A36E5|nr:DUF1178 family protein [Sphingopyxis sp. MWB1]
MIVFDLCCAGGAHRFEAWFASSDSFAEQKARRLIACPICGDSDVDKAVMAPRVGAKSNQRAAVPAPAPACAPVPAGKEPAAALPPELVQRVIAEIAARQAEILPRSRWVGRDFAAAARAMHEGRAPEDPIHGEASPDEVRELHDDGIAALPLLVPIAPPDAVN